MQLIENIASSPDGLRLSGKVTQDNRETARAKPTLRRRNGTSRDKKGRNIVVFKVPFFEIRMRG